MIDYSTARSIVQAKLDRMPAAFPNDAWQIIDDATTEYDWGWALFYDSRLHQQTGDFEFAVAGNAPLLVRRSDGSMLESCTAFSLERSIEAFFQNGSLP